MVITANTEDEDATNESANSGIEKYEYYVKKATDTTYPTVPYSTNEIEGLEYDTYNIYVKVYDKAGNNTNSNEVTVEIVNPKVSKYGQKVNYSANGVDDWKIFYINDERNETFIITSDYLPSNLVPTATTGMSVYGSYIAYWRTVPAYVEITQEVRQRFMMSWDVNKTSDGIRCASRLLDTSAWEIFVTDALKLNGSSAIGGPTIEMFFASWNEVYPENRFSFYSNTNPQGYQLFQSGNYSLDMRCAVGNTLYVPQTTNLGSSAGWWLATPEANGTRAWLSSVRYSYTFCSLCAVNPTGALRPLVCIPSNLLEYNSATSSWDINV